MRHIGYFEYFKNNEIEIVKIRIILGISLEVIVYIGIYKSRLQVISKILNNQKY